MLEKTIYDSWVSCIRLFIKGKKHDKMMLDSINIGLLRINDMQMIWMNMQQLQINTKFLNALPPEWSKFVTDVKLAKSLYTTNYDQLYAYLSQHERHAQAECITRKRYPYPLTLIAAKHGTDSRIFYEPVPIMNKQFFGHDKEDPHAHVRYFNKITSTLKFPNVPDTSIKLMLFPFSLEGAARIWLEKEPPRSIFTWDDLVSKFINQFFPPSRACPHQGFSELHQLDTFYNALNSKDQDSLNSAAGGNFLDRMPRECLGIIESKSKVRYSCNKPVVAKVSTTASTSGLSPDVAELKDMVRALLLDKKGQSPAPVKAVEESCVTCGVSTTASTSGISPDVAELKDMVRALLLDKKGQSPALVKAVEESCVTCGGAHSYRNCPATDGNNYRDNIQEFVSQASAVNLNQGNTGYRPPIMSNHIRPPGFPPVPNNQNLQRNNQNRFIPNQNQNRGNNFHQGPVYQPSIFQPPAYQAPAYQAPAPQTQSVLKEDFSAYVKANDVVMRNMQTQVHPKPVTYLISEPAITPVSASRPNPQASIPYPSRRDDERNRERTKDQIEKFYQIFEDMSFEISFADALMLMPKFASTLKALIENKEKLSEMARTPLNEHWSAVLLKKLPEKLGDPGKFLIPCDFPSMAKCLALADLGASINMMPYSV
nr:reverse transcriptase domain-containing protein [Tanacetum cinerariifolium]